MQQSVVKFYCSVVHTLLNMFRALQCPSSEARQTAVAASGFRMNMEVEVFSSVVGLLTLRRLMSYIYIYMEHPFLMFLDHTQRRSTVGRTPLDE